MMKGFSKVLAVIALSIFLVGAIGIHVGVASRTLIVPDDYSTIQDAVNHASAGDTVLVKSGVYHENVQIHTPLALQGENSSSTFIIGSGGSSPTAVLVLASDDVKVTGFTLQSLNYSKPTSYAYGIWVEGNNCTITGNIIDRTYTGIFCSVQSATTITGNTVEESLKNGICFYGGDQNTVSNNTVVGSAVSGIEMAGYSNTIAKNTVENNFRGVGLGATYSVVFGNVIASNSESGIFLAGSKNIISENSIADNKYGVFVTQQLTAPSSNQIYHNNLENNVYNAYDNSSALTEVWDNGAKSGGNYWSDYQTCSPGASEVGSSGTWSKPYVVNSSNKDNHPLMEAFNTANLGNPPAAISPENAKPNSVVASWSLGTVEPSLVSPDETGNNPAILGSETPVYNNTPSLVPGKFGDALNFTGNVFATVQPSLSLTTPNDVTIDAWVNVQAIKPGVVYNNIFIEAQRTTATLPSRTLGLAINGQAPENASSPPIGALRAYVVTPSGLNEIDTTTALPNDTWVHVVFTRSTTDGMFIYVNGIAQPVTVAAGSPNPSGPIQNPTDIYIGHDSKTLIQDLKISNTVEKVGSPQTQPLWTQWWLWAIVFLAVAAASEAVLLNRKRGKQRNSA